VPSATGRLLERERELSALNEALDRACAGDGTLILIEGPAGVGKTELGRETRAAAERAGMTPLVARGSELEQPFAFGVVRQLLEPALGEAGGAADLFTGAAAPAARLFERGERRSPDGDVGFEALHSLYWLMVNLADRGPLLIMVDDCQWADRDSLRFLLYMAQRIEGLRVAMLLTARPPDHADAETSLLWSQVASRPSSVALYPRPLSLSGAAAMARELLGDDAEEEFGRACHMATGGNPLFLRELLRGLAAAGVLPSAAAAGEVQAVGPAAVRRFVRHRLAALGPAATDLARGVAVLGDDSERALAARVSGVNEAAAREAADDLARAEIFARGERLGFVHPIVRAALYEDLAPGERHARHAAVADALAAAGASPERIAAHLMLTTATGDPLRVQTLRAAAAAAGHRGAPRAAAASLRRALDEAPETRERAEILSDLGRYEVAAMQFEAADEHLRACVSSGGELTTRVEAASWLGRCAIVSGGRSADAAVAALGSLAEEIRPLDPERSLALRSELLIVARSLPRLYDSLAPQLRRFSEDARGYPQFEAIARIHIAQEQLFAGGSAAAVVQEVQAALASGLPPGTEATSAFIALLVLRWAERYDLVSHALDAGLARARREGHAARQGMIHGQRAAISLAEGSLHEAQVEAETGLLLVHEPHFAVIQLLAVAINTHIERGAFDDALEVTRRGEALDVTEEGTYVPEFLNARGRLRIAQGQAREGIADLMWCGERLESIGVLWPNDWKAHAAVAFASLGEHDTAARLGREQLEVARRVGAPGALGLALRAAALSTRGEERLALLEEAVGVLERSAWRLELARALVDLGGALTRAGRRREARDLQRRAIKLADDCGALALGERARAELQAGPGRRARTELTGRSALTAAEWRVCRQAAAGGTNRDIAETLFVTEKTVERHLSSAYQKLGIRSRFQLAAAISE
jgi:DNA-binding CsgD family transcriptional regulator